MKPKYSIGDKVWYMEGENPTQKVILAIWLDTRGLRKQFLYSTYISSYDNRPSMWQSQNRLFPTKADLINSL